MVNRSISAINATGCFVWLSRICLRLLHCEQIRSQPCGEASQVRISR